MKLYYFNGNKRHNVLTPRNIYIRKNVSYGYGNLSINY